MSDTNQPYASPQETPSSSESGSSGRYRWLQSGDVNAFFGLMLDNVVGLMLMVAILAGFGFPKEFAVAAMVPGTALGVLIGDLAFVYFAFRLAKKTGRDDVTAMPLGLDTPSTFGYCIFILGPSYLAGIDPNGLALSATDAAYRTWHIGIWCIVMSGCVKLTLAPFTEWIRRVVPRAGLLGSLAAIALVLISFMPLIEILGHPLPGILALVIVLSTLIGRLPLPGRTPGTLGALIVAGLVYYAICGVGAFGYEFPTSPVVQWFPTTWMEAWQFKWVGSFNDALQYLPIALPFAIGTVVGGIDCTESAAAAGDKYDTRTVIGVEAVATLLAGLSGGVIQTTPYIGHPAYKAMGGRAGYTLGTALLIGSAGLIGYFSLLNVWIPKPVVMPILVFVGLEITAQSFLATPRRHYAAVAFACLPALAVLAMNIPGRLFGDGTLMNAGINPGTLQNAELAETIETLTMLSSGFILTSLFWAWALAAAIDRKLGIASLVMLACMALTFFGIMHSPLPGNELFVPYVSESWAAVLNDGHELKVLEFALGYGAAALFFVALMKFGDVGEPVEKDDDELETQ